MSIAQDIRRAFDDAFRRMCAAPSVWHAEDELSNLLHHLYRLRDLVLRTTYEGDKRRFFAAIANLPATRAALWARNMDAHDLVVTASLEDAHSNFYTNMYGVLVWSPLTALPIQHDEHGRHLDYSSVLSGRPVLDTICRAFDDLAALV